MYKYCIQKLPKTNEGLNQKTRHSSCEEGPINGKQAYLIKNLILLMIKVLSMNNGLNAFLMTIVRRSDIIW